MDPVSRSTFKLIRMSTKVVTLGLQDIGTSTSVSVTVEKGQGRCESGDGNAQKNGLRDDATERGNATKHGFAKEGI